MPEEKVRVAETEFFEARLPFAVHSVPGGEHAPTESDSITMLAEPEGSTDSPTMTVPPMGGQQQSVVLHEYPLPIL